MKVSYKWLQTYFDAPLPSAETLADLFTFHSFEIEGVESFVNSKGESDTIIDAKILPDRGHYCLCHKGIASEVALLTKTAAKSRVHAPVAATTETKPTITIEDSAFCRRYMGRSIRNISVGAASPAWLADFLNAIGQRSINPIVDGTNIVMFDVGQPLHAFDADKVKGNIVVRKAKPAEAITLLDGREISLQETDFVIADDEGALAIAGVKGGKRAEVTAATKNIILEAANFEPAAVRRTSTRLNLRNESSKRFENEITAELAAEAMHTMSALIKEMSPEASFGPVVDVYPVPATQTVISIMPSYISDRLGVTVSAEEAKTILERMNIGITISETATNSSANSEWKLTIPHERLDLTIADDIVEEVGRIYGYEKIQGILPPTTAKVPSVLPAFYLAEKIKNVLVAQGFSEANLYSLVQKGEIETAYPLSKDKSFARKNLIDGMMSTLEKNALNADLLGLETIQIFEIGRVFTKEKETTVLAIGVSQVKKIKGVSADQIAKSACDALQKELDVDISAPNSLSKGIHTVIEIDLDEVVGQYKHSASYADLGFGPASENRYERYSQYPFMVRDIAVFVPEGTEPESVWAEIEKGIEDASAKKLLTRKALFDSFKKDGKVSYAFRMVFQAMDRTLTDEEANAIMQKVYTRMATREWQVR